jgi:aminomuconate-semialdehyde/2-hydroxymuconate-6-semialdehyde dehydrogenase
MKRELAEGHWVQPTIWTGLPETARRGARGDLRPCCHIAPFDTEEEAVALANATDYGLATPVWTENLGRAHRMARQIEVGICWINSWFLRDLRTALRRRQVLGHRPRRRRAFARVLHRAAQRLHQALRSMGH